MAVRTLICFPSGDAPGLQTEAAQLALGLAELGNEVIALGQLGAWRHALRSARVAANEFALLSDENKLIRTIQEHEPHVIHAFGAETANAVLPLTLLVGAGGMATLGHSDLTRINPTQFRTASVVFVPCDFLREQVARRLPSVPVINAGYLLPPPADASPAQQRFLAEELGVRDDAPMVLLADRFHGSETEVARTLIEATPLIAQHVPAVQIVIAGGGVRLGELEGQAIDINDRLGYRAVLLPGHRDDVQQLLGLATVAVGSGRFAMEAVGAGRALVAIGPGGMVGTFTDDAAQVAHFTCCGRHGHLERVPAKTLAAEVVGLFQYHDHRERFAVEGQRSMLATAQRNIRATQIATYYARSAPAGTISRTPQRLTAILPDDLRELLFTLPAISGIRQHFPLAKLSLVAAHQHLGLLQQLGLAGWVLPKPRRLREWPRLVRALSLPRPDVCVSFTGDAVATLLTGCSLAPHRLGFAEGSASLLLSDHLQARIPPSPERALTLVHALGISTGAPVTLAEMPLATQETVNLSLLAVGIGYDEPIILLCPQADEIRMWPVSHWTTLVRLLAEARSERIVVLGAEGLPLPPGVIQVAPVQDSLTLAALLLRVNLVVAPDNGSLHLADLLGVPTVGLFGPTSPESCALPNPQRNPLCHREFPCHPCVDTPCRERHCLRALTPAEVTATVSVMLDTVLLPA